MRLRIAAIAATAIAAMMLLAGCNKAGSNSNNAGANTTNNAGPATTPSATPTSTATTSTGDAGSTPTATFTAYYNAIKNNDAAAVKAIFSKDTIQALEEEAKQQKKSFDDVFQEGLKSASAEVPAQLPEVRNEKIDGDRATLEIKDDKKGTWEPLHFVKEDGKWKVSFNGGVDSSDHDEKK